ncbi:MAG: aldose epimerase family protein [Candidatus Hydrogenedentota bacterium]
MYRTQFSVAGLVCLVAFAGCKTSSSMTSTTPTEAHAMSIDRQVFGTTSSGEQVDLYTLTNSHGVEARITNFGGIVVSLKAPDRHGELEDIVLGFDELDGYVAEHPYFGAIVGRYGNRIAKGKFTLDGETYTLAVNNGPNALHGGLVGFDKKVWDAEPIEEDQAAGLKLHYTSPAGEEGYPGTLDATVTYLLTNADELKIHYEATTDAPTVVNLTNHSYFNLDGAEAGPILDHEVMINAKAFTPVDETLIPTGEMRPVADTPFDFTKPKPIGQDIAADNEQMQFGGGYDHNFVLDKPAPGLLSKAAEVYAPDSGRVLEVHTTEPGMQFYTGNFLDGTLTGKGGVKYEHRYGFCMETQHFPDSPNQPDFPSTVLRPGERYTSTTVYKFSAK